MRNGANLTTTEGAGIYGITVDGATWTHTGPVDHVPMQITLLNNGRFESAKLSLRSTEIRAQSGSIVNVGDLTTLSRVQIESGSQLIDTTAAVSGDVRVDGTGSKWTVSSILAVPAAAKITATNRAEITLQTVDFSDPAQFAQLIASGTDSRIRVLKRFKLYSGNATAVDGGIFSVPSLEVGGARQVIVGRGPAGLGGAQFNGGDEMLIGSASGAGSVAVNGGGLLSARTVSIGRGTVQSSVTVNGIGGSARFEPAETVVVGDAGAGVLRVTNGGRLEFTEDGGLVLISTAPAGGGEVDIEGSDSLVDLKTGAMHVGRGGPARLNVTGGARLQGASLNIGDNQGTNHAPFIVATVSGEHSTAFLREGFLYVGAGTLRVANGGFVQISSDVVEGRIEMETPAVMDLSTGSVELGNAGGAPVGILRIDRGLLEGSGTIRCNSAEVIAQGRCRPGDFVSSHELRIEGGSYLQDANGTLEIDVYGTGASQFGTLNVARGASLNGKLIVTILGGFTPKAGDQIGFLHAGEGISGAFSSIEIRGLRAGVTYEQRILEQGIYGIEFTSDAEEDDCDDEPAVIERVESISPAETALTVTAGICGINWIEYSVDLKSWRRLQEFTPDTTGRARVIDRRKPLFPALYYRVVTY